MFLEKVSRWMTKIIPIFLMVAGLLAFGCQLTAMAVWLENVDKAGVGIWGGFYIIGFGILLFSKTLQRSAFVMAASVVAILVGATTFALYMYNLFTYVHLMDGNCQANYPNIIDLCDRAAIDGLMIISGIIMIVDGVIVFFTPSSYILKKK